MSSFNPIHLANELHDGVIQEISALLLQLEIYQRKLKQDPQDAQAELDKIKLHARDTLRHLRQLVVRLRADDWEQS